MNFHDFPAQDGSENDLKLAQDRSKTVPEAIFFHVEFWLQFWTVLGSVLAPFWDPFGLQDRSKIGPKIIRKLSWSSISLQDRPERPQDLPKTPQEVSRSPQEAPKTLPRGSKRLQEGPKTARILSNLAPECPKMVTRDIIFLQLDLSDLLFVLKT